MHRRYENHTFFDSTLRQNFFNLRRYIDILAVLFRVKPKIFSAGFHRISFSEDGTIAKKPSGTTATRKCELLTLLQMPEH